MYPDKFSVSGFDISHYEQERDDKYIYLIANQWHIVEPDKINFANKTEECVYREQFDAFCDHIVSEAEKDVASGKYRDYAITDIDGNFCGIVDVGTLYFDTPEVGIILMSQYRNKGYGYIIMKEFIKRVKEASSSQKVIWRSEKNNIAAIMLALKLGGRESFAIEGFRCFEI